MKKIIALLLALTISLFFCACGKKSNTTESMTVGQIPQSSEQIDFSSVVTVVSSPAPAAETAPEYTPEPTQAPVYTPEPTQTPVYTPEVPQTAVSTPIPSAAVSYGTSATTGYVKITKSPTSETVNPGGSAVFTAYGENYTKIEWLTASPGTTDRTIYVIDDAPAHFSGLTVSGQGTNVLTLSNIPVEMNGWEIQAKFIGSMDTKWSDDAYITVNGAGTSSTTTSGITADTDTEKLVLAQAKACLDGISTYGRTLGYSVGGFENYSYNNGKADFNVTLTGSQYTIIGEFIATDSTYYPIYANGYGTSSTTVTPMTFQQCTMNDFYTVLSSPQSYIK